MKQFDLYEPTSLSEAAGLLNQFGAGAKAWPAAATCSVAS